jgi:hypothetical protein
MTKMINGKTFTPPKVEVWGTVSNFTSTGQTVCDGDHLNGSNMNSNASASGSNPNDNASCT